MNIVLTGFMATGKTKISRCLAKLTDYDLIDTDEMIESGAGMSINDIFSKYGEEYFRDLETDAVKRASKMDRTIISTGGGTVLRSENINALRENGVIVNLAPDFDVIRERMEKAAGTRPLMNGQSAEAVKKRFDERQPFYDNCDIKINVTNEKTPEEHAREILRALDINNF